MSEPDPNMEFLASLDKELDQTAKVREIVANAMAKGMALSNAYHITGRTKRMRMGKAADDAVNAIMVMLKEEK
jgi:hypothetical protein